MKSALSSPRRKTVRDYHAPLTTLCQPVGIFLPIDIFRRLPRQTPAGQPGVRAVLRPSRRCRSATTSRGSIPWKRSTTPGVHRSSLRSRASACSVTTRVTATSSWLLIWVSTKSLIENPVCPSKHSVSTSHSFNRSSRKSGKRPAAGKTRSGANSRHKTGVPTVPRCAW